MSYWNRPRDINLYKRHEDTHWYYFAGPFDTWEDAYDAKRNLEHEGQGEFCPGYASNNDNELTPPLSTQE